MANDALAEHCVELLSSLGAARARRMFGGHGLYLDGLFVGLIAFDRLYLKTDEASRPRFEAAGCEAFAYERKGERRSISNWWTAPAEAMESPALMAPWARMALQAALTARAAQAAKPAKKPALKRRAANPARRASAKTKAR